MGMMETLVSHVGHTIRFQFQKLSQFFIGVHREPLTVVSMCVSNPDCSGLHGPRLTRSPGSSQYFIATRRYAYTGALLRGISIWLLQLGQLTDIPVPLCSTARC